MLQLSGSHVVLYCVHLEPADSLDAAVANTSCFGNNVFCPVSWKNIIVDLHGVPAASSTSHRGLSHAASVVHKCAGLLT